MFRLQIPLDTALCTHALNTASGPIRRAPLTTPDRASWDPTIRLRRRSLFPAFLTALAVSYFYLAAETPEARSMSSRNSDSGTVTMPGVCA